jgi:plastocyanin
MRKLIAVFGVVIVALAASMTGQAKILGTLKGESGPGFSIEVTKGKTDVKKLKHGSYKIKVEDKSAIHNFHLKGPGVNKKTGVSFVGDKTWTVTLKKGTYTYQCDVHVAQGMKGTFKVT